MVVPLLDFKRLLEKDFFTDTEARRNEYFSILSSYYDSCEEKTIDSETGIYFFDYDHSNMEFLKNSGTYVYECYEEIEQNDLISIKNQIYNILDFEKSKVYVGQIISELNYISKIVKGFRLDKHLQASQSKVVSKILSFISYLDGSFIKKSYSSQALKKMPKIRWLADAKLLTTLFYDLMNGQAKNRVGETPTRRFIDADIVQVERMIVDNFLNEFGQPLNPETIHKYFKSENENGRVAEGGRIELGFGQ